MYEAPVSNVLVGLADASATSTSEVTTTTTTAPAAPKLLTNCL